MRKQDYETLAREIAHSLTMSRAVMADPKSTEHDLLTAKGGFCSVANLAQNLAKNLAVDKSAFLTACGLRP